MPVKIVFQRWSIADNIKCLFHMEFTLSAIRVYASIVINPIGDIGILQNLRNHNPFANGVKRTRGMKKLSPLCTDTAWSTSASVLF